MLKYPLLPPPGSDEGAAPSHGLGGAAKSRAGGAGRAGGRGGGRLAHFWWKTIDLNFGESQCSRGLQLYQQSVESQSESVPVRSYTLAGASEAFPMAFPAPTPNTHDTVGILPISRISYQAICQYVLTTAVGIPTAVARSSNYSGLCGCILALV